MFWFFFQAEDGIRDAQESRGLGDVYKRQPLNRFYSYHDQLLDDKKRADAAGTAFEDEQLLKVFNRTRAKLTEINREKDDIRLDPDLSRKDKRELIDMLENRAAEYAKAAMAVYYESKGIE